MRALDTDVEAEAGVSRSFCLSLSLSLSVQPFKYQPVHSGVLKPRRPAWIASLLGFFKRSVAREPHQDVKPPGEPSAGGALSEGAHRHSAESTESDPNPAIPDRHTRAPAGGSSG